MEILFEYKSRSESLFVYFLFEVSRYPLDCVRLMIYLLNLMDQRVDLVFDPTTWNVDVLLYQNSTLLLDHTLLFSLFDMEVACFDVTYVDSSLLTND